jgi:hypothetical protein
MTSRDNQGRSRGRVDAVLHVRDVRTCERARQRSPERDRRREWIRDAETVLDRGRCRNPFDGYSVEIFAQWGLAVGPAAHDAHLVTSGDQPVRKVLAEAFDAADVRAKVSGDERSAPG